MEGRSSAFAEASTDTARRVDDAYFARLRARRLVGTDRIGIVQNAADRTWQIYPCR